MELKHLFILRNTDDLEDLPYIQAISEINDIKLKILLQKPSNIFIHEWNYPLNIRPIFVDILKNAEIAITFPNAPNKYSDDSLEKAKLMKIHESGIKIVNPHSYVAEAVKDGYQVTKW